MITQKPNKAQRIKLIERENKALEKLNDLSEIKRRVLLEGPIQKKPCKHKSRKPLIFKLGGLICPNCRVILHEAYSPKWLKEFQKLRKFQKRRKNDIQSI